MILSQALTFEKNLLTKGNVSEASLSQARGRQLLLLLPAVVLGLGHQSGGFFIWYLPSHSRVNLRHFSGLRLDPAASAASAMVGSTYKTPGSSIFSSGKALTEGGSSKKGMMASMVSTALLSSEAGGGLLMASRDSLRLTTSTVSLSPPPCPPRVTMS